MSRANFIPGDAGAAPQKSDTRANFVPDAPVVAVVEPKKELQIPEIPTFEDIVADLLAGNCPFCPENKFKLDPETLELVTVTPSIINSIYGHARAKHPDIVANLGSTMKEAAAAARELSGAVAEPDDSLDDDEDELVDTEGLEGLDGGVAGDGDDIDEGDE